MDRKRYVVIATHRGPTVRENEGYFEMFIIMLSKASEMWDIYPMAWGEFPRDDVIESYDGFVITGSCNDAHGNDLWITKLIIPSNKLDATKKKILDIFFGR